MGDRLHTPSVFQYRDYRQYLKDWYEEKKKEHHGFSFRNFSRHAGFSSSNFLLLVMKARRNLTKQSLAKFNIGLGLNKQEAEFFENLVFFNQAKQHEQKDLYYHRLLQNKKIKQLMPIEKKHYDYYSEWYHPVIRELAASKNFDGTPEWLAKRIVPQITPLQVSKSLKLLEDLGLLERVDGNKYKQSHSILSTGPELKSLIVHNYHKSLLDITKQLMDRLPLKEKEVSTMTLGIKREHLEMIKEKIRALRRDILELVSLDTEPETVVQFNIQLLPLADDKNASEGKGGSL